MHIQSGQKFFFKKKGEKKELRKTIEDARIQFAHVFETK